MLEELKSITSKWQILLLKLGMEKYQIEVIEINRPGNVELQKQDAFDQWLHQKHNACWADVTDALYKIGENTLAKKLEEKYNWKDPRVCSVLPCKLVNTIDLLKIQLYIYNFNLFILGECGHHQSYQCSCSCAHHSYTYFR